MGARDELVGLYWTTSGPVEVHVGREWSLFDLARPLRAGGARRLQRASGSGTPTSSTCSRRARCARCGSSSTTTGSAHLELEFLGDWFLDPDDERRRASDETRALLFEAAAALPAHHIKVGNLVGTPCELPRIVERYAELCEDAARHTDAKIVYEFMPYDVERQRRRQGARGRRGRGRAQRRPRARHVAPGQAPARARRPPPHPAAVPVLGRALRRPVRVRGGPARRGDQPPQAARRGRVPDRRVRRRVPGARATTGPGASRCSPRSSATSRSSRSSSAPTRRRARSSPLAQERSLGV